LVHCRSFPVGSAVSFTIASSGDPGIAVRTGDATFKAYDAVCPHAGCTVGYSAPNSLLVCPCHASEFQVSDGSLITGPSPTGLTALQCTVHDGDVYIA
jgi:thiosulfate dehydrogenase [quinone] large subunit